MTKSTEQIRPKAKRKLSEIDFNTEGAHLALVTTSQGGPASGHDYALVMKAANFSEEFIQKVQQVKVTMELPEFLRKFFYLYGEDAEILAAMMGYVEPAEDPQEDIQDWIAEKMSSFELIKSLNDSASLPEALSKLTEDEYLSVVKDQALVEKAFRKLKRELKKVSGKSLQDKSETSTDASVENIVEPTGSLTKSSKELNMPKTQVIEQEVEVIEKAQYTILEKALADQKVELEKALNLVEEFKKEKQEALTKARFEKIKAAVKDEAQAEVLFKAANLVEDEVAFEAIVKTLSDMKSVVEKSTLFTETGMTTEETEPKEKESAVARVLKSKFAPK